jgi:Rps23 Pro-64 3,4-dihydroxylase Tpa1-like proline 4-hydroxylase
MTGPAGTIFHRLPPHVVRRDFLPPEEHAGILAWALANEALFKPATVTGNVVRPRFRNALHFKGTAEWTGMLRARVMAALPGLIAEVGLVAFSADKLEIEMVAYQDGGFILRHVDTGTSEARSARDRIFSAVYYFHREPKPFTGGELRLMPLKPPPPGMPGHVDIAPEQNSLAAFPSWAPHEVLPVRAATPRFADSRFAINLWGLGALNTATLSHADTAD